MFRDSYILRRYGEQTLDEGIASFSYEDIPVSLNVQPISATELQALPEGDRSVQRVRAFGDFPVKTANQNTSCPSDRLYYHDKWFECEQSSDWHHTPLAHYESQWVAVPEGEEESPPEEGEQIDS